MNTVNETSAKRERVEVGWDDQRIDDVEQARSAALAEDIHRCVRDLDNGPGRDRHGSHDAPTMAQRIAEASAEMIGERVSVDHVGAPDGWPLDTPPPVTPRPILTLGGPDTTTDAAEADRWLIWSNQHGMWWRSHGVGYTSIIEEAGRYSRAEAAKHVAEATIDGALTHRRTDPITGREYSSVDEVAVPAPYGARYAEGATVSAYTDRLTFPAGDLDAPVDPKWQVIDGKDDTTWHDLTAITDCEDPTCAIPGPDVECVVLVSTAWAEGFAHFPDGEYVDVRIPASRGAQA